MCGIREFESALKEIKTKGAYKGVTYKHAGPAHLSIGQEAAAVGMAFPLAPDDHIFGSHRSHGEILAKGFSAIRQLSDGELLRHHGDAIATARCSGRSRKASPARRRAGAAVSSSTAPTARSSRAKPASTAGWAAPCTPSSPPSASIPNNAIVGGSGSIAPGAALFKRVNRKPGIVVANIGDASFGCGPVWEGITFSAMDQYRTSGTQSLGGGLPIIFNCMNNFYGMGGQPFGETMGMQSIARIGAGVNPDQMHAERVNGYDPLPVIDAFRRKKQILQRRPRARPARHGDLPDQRPLAVGRLELPLEGGDRALAAGRFDPRLPREAARQQRGRRKTRSTRRAPRSKRRSSTCSRSPSISRSARA